MQQQPCGHIGGTNQLESAMGVCGWHETAAKRFEQKAQIVRTLRRLYFAIADEPTSVRERGEHYEEPLECPPAALQVSCQPLSDVMPLNWPTLPLNIGLPLSFVSFMWQFILDQDSQGCSFFAVSSYELVAMLYQTEDFSFPAISPTSGRWVDAQTVLFGPEKLAFAVQLRLVKKAVVAILRRVNLESFWGDNWDRTARLLLKAFTARRPIRTAADLARPFG